MKQCSTCNLQYKDRAVKFCRIDGTSLQSMSASEISVTAATLLFPDSSKDKDQIAAGTFQSIAVLPFVNMSAETENDFFCDGLSEELINELVKIKQLRVVSRTSSFAYKGKDMNVCDIGSELNVSTLLEGSVRKMGSRLRITAQLINVNDGYHLWSKKYDRKLEDIFDLQDQISTAIVNELMLKAVSQDLSCPNCGH